MFSKFIYDLIAQRQEEGEEEEEESIKIYFNVLIFLKLNINIFKLENKKRILDFEEVIFIIIYIYISYR